MTRTRRSARPRRHRIRTFAGAGVIAVIAAVVVPLGYRSMETPSGTAAPADSAAPVTPVTPAAPDASAPAPRTSSPRREHGGPVGEADGVVPDGTTVFDDATPAVAELDAELLEALREAAADASAYGVGFQVNSGWRSAAYQERLLREAVAEHGSVAEAARWVATPETSPHVSGDAVDIGGSDAQTWLFEHGAAYGLCPVYRNEPWHYELRTEAVDGRCPPMYADPTHDPRMQR